MPSCRPASLLVVSLVAASVFGAAFAEPSDDPYLWLEEVESPEALAWVRAHNEPTIAALESDPRFPVLYDQVEAILNATDRIPEGRHRGGWFYNFWQDAEHVRGLWRRCTLESFRTEAPEWETLLDMDALAEAEGENWVFKGAAVLEPDFDRALIQLSRGGKDAVVLREFDVPSRSFVEDGFRLPEAKGETAWIDSETVLVGTDFGEGSLTESGYPRIVKRWRRGTPLEEAVTVFEGAAADAGLWPWVVAREDGVLVMIRRWVTTFETELHVWDGEAFRLLPVPSGARARAVFGGSVLFSAREDWERPGAATIPAGALFAADAASFLETGELPEPRIVYLPDERTTLSDVEASGGAVWVSVLRDVRGELLRLTPDAGAGWTARRIDLPENGTVGIASTNGFDDLAFVSYSSFLVPDRVMEVDPGTLETEVVKSLPERFDASSAVVEQLFAESPDGTNVPYFLVRPRERPAGAATATLLHGYGGFEISQRPSYREGLGKLWLERGGAYAVANIRGGGEYGPRWHRAALREKRQVSFDDFHAVAKDLIARGITDTDRLGIVGGSQGGLLVGVAMTQRPDLYAATVCQVPLLDMLRYHRLPPGASWMGEYGDPDDPGMAQAIAAYSPYQNLRPGVRYRNVLLVTSTKDDRVHPGHARKMAARMEELGQTVRYYENVEGGHAGAANRNQSAYRVALEFTHLSQALGLE